MNEMELLVDFHIGSKRQGPGGEKETLKAWNYIKPKLRKEFKLADIGCGSGASTRILCMNTGAYITAVDLFPEFLNQLDEWLQVHEMKGRVTTLNASMDQLPWGDEEFDVLWSEGAIYNIGFEKGIREWRKYLKSGGYMALSELSWLTDSRPEEIDDYWTKEYSEIDTIEIKKSILQKNDCEYICHFVLPEYCRLDNYYIPMENRMQSFLEKHNHSPMAVSLINAEKKEISLYKRYK